MPKSQVVRSTPQSRAARKSPASGAAARTAAADIDALVGDPNFMTSLARGLALIQGFSQERRRMTIAQLGAKTGIPRAAVWRCLYTLAPLGYIAGDDARTYSLRPKLLGLGHAYLSSTPLVVLAQPFLDRVSEAVDESCSLGTLDGDDTLYLARSLTSRIISVTLNVGSRLPAYCTSIGCVLLAHLPERELDDYLQRTSRKIFLVQLADFMWQETRSFEERINTARHFRVFPGEGVHSDSVVQRVRRLDELGYRGDYSFEVFNDDYVQLPLHVVAARARRSVAWLAGRVPRRSVPMGKRV